MNAATPAIAELGVKCGHGVKPFFAEHRLIEIGRQYSDAWAGATNNGSANEHRFCLVASHIERYYAAIDLAPIAIAFDGNIHESKRTLTRVEYFVCEQNSAGASTKNGPLIAELQKRLEEALHVEELQHCRAFAAGEDKAINRRKLIGGAHFRSFAPGRLNRRAVRLKVTLQSKNADARSCHQPRTCINSDSGSFEMSRPGMASPSSSLASSSFKGS